MHRNRGNLNSRLMRWRSSSPLPGGRGRPVAPQSVVFINAVYNACVRILISAGEASGEMYGAQLIEALRQQSSHVWTGALARPEVRSTAPSPNNQLEFFGVGGDKMRAAGCDIVVDA